MARKKANGEGNIRKRDNGTWEARATIDGKSKSVYGKTQAEVRRKLTEILSSVDNGTYIPDTGMTIAQWLEIWQRDYLRDVKESTKGRYEQDVRLHIAPYIGAVRLADLNAPTVQRLYNQAQDRGLSEKTIRCIHGTLHKALEKAVECELIRKNACDRANVPRLTAPTKDIAPFSDGSVKSFLSAIAGNQFGPLFYVTLFTGMREGEIIGLTWDCIDFQRGTIHLYRQLQRVRASGGQFRFTTLKNKEDRTFKPPANVLEMLKQVRIRQTEWRWKAGETWGNADSFVFTNEAGEHFNERTVYKNFKKIAESIGLPQARFHDLRHTYATLALQNGVDVKTVSATLGHATVAFTLDKYGHVSDTMMRDSAEKMQRYIEGL